MIFGITAPRRSRQRTHRKIETGRAKLPLVVTVGRKIDDLVRTAGVLERVGNGSVDFGISAAALLVIHLSRVADVGDHEPMLDATYLFLVHRQPRDRAYRPRDEDEPVRIPQREAAQ